MLIQSAIFLGAAVVAVPIFTRLGLGAVLGYLAAGAVIGPSGLGLISEVEDTLHIAELGVVLLLFIIGLELQPTRLWRMRGAVLGVGGAQLALTTLAVALGSMLLGASWQVALVIGLALSMSSTAFATQLLGEKHELGTAHGRAAFGILLFQDLAAIPILALVPMLGAAGPQSHDSGPWRAPLVIGVITGLVLIGRHLLNPAFRFIAQAKSHELSAAAALLVVVGTGLIMQSLGLSMALGSFLAGVLLSDSAYRHELEANIEPFKGLLLGLFFMAVGMSANLHVVLDQPLQVFGVVLALIAVKMGILYALGRRTGQRKSGAFSLAIAISQGGEFAFVIFGVARQAGVLQHGIVELLVVAVTLSMGVTPLLFLLRDNLKKRVATRQPTREFDEIPDEGSQVIIAGFGRFGQIVGRVLRVKRIPFTALDVNPTHVDFVRRFGNKIYYGDAARVDLLRAAGAERAKVFVLAIDDMEASLRTLKTVQSHFPHLKIVARARNRQHAYALLGSDLDVVIRENFLGSVEAARRTLEELGIPSADARSTVKRFAEYDEQSVRNSFALRDDQQALIASSKQYAAELERIFEQDARA
ncbi:MAG TPA: monovalent cation:proton antiporter-2 (CPA2) family protein [Polyangiaceae bacterium]|nr:monovalent cation:proton antiporter-2 (CPA2) family protein [Polyangiaceae bacterium]